MGPQRRPAAKAYLAAAATVAIFATPFAPITSAQAATARCNGVISGKITSTNGRPVAGVAVSVDAERSSGRNDVAVKTSPAGEYKIGSVCSGTAWVTAADEERWWIDSSRSMTTKNAATTIANFTIEPAGELLVKVANATEFRYPKVKITGTSASSARIDHWDNEMWSASVAVTGGTAELYKVPTGQYRITTTPGHRKFRTTIQGANTRVVAVSQFRRDAVAFAIDRGGALKGKVTPKPVRNADGQRGYVTVRSSQGFRAMAAINKYGNYTIKNLPPGKYRVHFWIATKTTRDWMDYYRAGRKTAKAVKVKQGKTLKLKTTKLRGKMKGSPYLWFEP